MYIAVAVVVVVIAVVAYRLLSANGAARSGREAVGFDARPRVADFHIRDDVALVLFDVEVGAGVEDHAAEVLTAEAVEVVRDKSESLPIGHVTTVVAQAKGADGSVEVGRVHFETPGELPPPLLAPPPPHASSVGFDPLEAYSEGLSGAPPSVASSRRDDELGPAGSDLTLPTTFADSLSRTGVDPASMSAGDVALELLSSVGYTVAPGPKPDCYIANRGGANTYIYVVGIGDYPEIESQHINSFMVDFLASRADRGLLISDRYGPFEVYDREKREPRVRFVTRERLQGFVDALTVS